MPNNDTPKRLIRRSRDGNEGVRKGLGCTRRSIRLDGYGSHGRFSVPAVREARKGLPIICDGADAYDVWAELRELDAEYARMDAIDAEYIREMEMESAYREANMSW